MSACAYPIEFPAEAAVNVGKAIMSRSFSRANAKDAWCLQGYLQGQLFGDGSDTKPVFGGGVAHDDDALGSLLVQAGEESEARTVAFGVGENATDPKALPVAPILKLLAKLLLTLL